MIFCISYTVDALICLIISLRSSIMETGNIQDRSFIKLVPKSLHASSNFLITFVTGRFAIAQHTRSIRKVMGIIFF